MNNIIHPDPNCIALIQSMSNAFGPSGFEEGPITAARAFMKDSVTIKEDCLRNLYFYRKENTGHKPVFMLDAHNDEVGFMVHSIRPNGTLRFVTLGSFAVTSLPSSKVLVRNRFGDFLPGVIAAKPVHFMSAGEKNGSSGLAVSDLSIDVGAVSREEAIDTFGIQIGEPIVPNVTFEYNEEKDLMIGKAFDCRIGGAALMETMRRLEKEELAVDVVGVLSSQEEIGERGIKVAVHTVKPDIALCYEGCPADDTFTESYAIQTALKKGPMIRFMDTSVICSPRYQRHTLALAQEKNLMVQSSVREGGGNNGAIINTSLNGIPVIVMGVPVRYIHSHHGISSYRDFEATVQLAVAVVKSMSQSLLDTF
ncbi:MAG: M42 family peptidase [Lachnospiraceae bacterium]